MKAYPRWFYHLLLLSLFVLLITGFLLIPTTLDMRFEYDVIWRLEHSQRLITVATHTTVSYFLIAFLGALFTVHMRSGLKRRQSLITGIGLASSFLLLLLTGIGLFYFGNESLILLSSTLHILIGLMSLVLFTGHFILAKKQQA